MSYIEIVIATVEDIDAIALLFTEQFYVQADLQPYLNKRGEQDRKFIETTVISTESQIYIAKESGHVVGFISVFEKKTADFSFKVQHKYAYIMDIIVTKEYRGKGIATGLMNAAKQWASERKLEYVELTVLANNPAVDFYKKNNYEEIVKTMICRL